MQQRTCGLIIKVHKLNMVDWIYLVKEMNIIISSPQRAEGITMVATQCTTLCRTVKEPEMKPNY